MPTLNWIGKDAVIDHHRRVPLRLLECDRALSAGDPDAGNLLVQGDNLEALKALLPRYKGQVKCIYIDPPYNTGNEGWVYNDNVNDPRIKKWLGDVVGKEAEDLCRHDKWLCMMYPRLALLRELLRDDGVIFVSIDDNAVQGLRPLMDELFGIANFLGTVIWEKSDSPRMDVEFFSSRHDYVLVYARTRDRARISRISGNGEAAEHYDQVDAEGRKYYLKPLRAMGGQGDTRAARPGLYYAMIAPDGTEVYPKRQDGTDGAWRWSPEKVAEEAGRIEWKRGRNGWTPYFRIYFNPEAGRPPETVWFHQDVGSNRTSKAELKGVIADLAAFATPKPLGLLKRIIHISCNSNDLILDSFAGSGTTGHAVLEMNKSDGGTRKFILVEMDEKISHEVTGARLRRVIEGDGRDLESLGSGFRFCRLGKTLFDEHGEINHDVPFADLARFVYLIETGVPVPARPRKDHPLLGVHEGRAVYLLYNGVLGDRRPAGGNVLTHAVLDALPPHPGSPDAPRVVYGEACRLGEATLRRLNVTFRQTPYALREG